MKLFFIMAGLLIMNHAYAAEIFLYTDRKVEMLKPIAEAFEKETGEKVWILKLSYNEIINRLEVEGENSYADVIFVKDMVYLADLANKDALQPMTTNVPAEVVASEGVHPENLWTAITMRARTLVYSTERVNVEELTSYKSLADQKWKGKLCLRTSQNSYSEALGAHLVYNYGYDAAKELLTAWVDNLATVPYSSDRDAMDAIVEGTCDVAVVNSYYLAGKLSQDSSYPVGISFVEQNGESAFTGVHTNGTGAGIAKYSKNVEGANKFIEFLLKEKWQLFLSSAQLDYPASKDLAPESLVKDWGTFKGDAANWSTVADYIEDARVLFEEVGYQ